MANKRKKFIIIESQINLREVIVFCLESQFNLDAIRVDNYEEAYDALRQHTDDISFIFCGNCNDFQDKIKIYNAYIINRLSTIMQFFDFSQNMNPLSCNGTSVAIKIMRSTNLDLLVNFMEGHFDIDYSVPKTDFTPISIDSLSFLDQVKNCVYIKLISGRYLKLFQPEDVILEEDILRFKSKGVSHLHLKKDTYSWVIKNLNQQYKNILRDNKYQLTISKPDTEEIDTTIFEQKPLEIELDGLNIEFDYSVMDEIPEKMDLIKARLKKSTALKDHIKSILQNKKLENFIENRTNLLIYFSCAIAQELEWKSAQIIEKLIYCAYVHDILLYNYPKILIYDALGKIDENNDLLNSFEHEFYKKHTEMTLKLIEKDALAPKEAYVIIGQHHEQSDGSGFPHGLDHKRINALSAIFNISLELANELMKNSKLDYNKYLNSKKILYKGDAYKKGLKALEKIITKNQL